MGRLAPLGELRSLATPFGAADARVAEVLVTEGQHVSAGATLGVFDTAAALQAAWRFDVDISAVLNSLDMLR